MRNILRTIAATALIASATVAFAAQQHAEGVVKQYDAARQILTLDSGTTYVLPHNYKDAALKNGVKVDVAYNVTGGKNVAESVKIIK